MRKRERDPSLTVFDGVSKMLHPGSRGRAIDVASLIVVERFRTFPGVTGRTAPWVEEAMLPETLLL